MKFACDRCQTKYSIADERVRGKVLKVKCKTCANLITVREARRPSGSGIPTAGPVVHSGAVAAQAVPQEAEFSDSSSRTVLSSFPALEPHAPPAPPPPPHGHSGPAAPLASPEDGLQWYMALDGERTGPFSRKQLVDKIAPLSKQADVHVWNEKLGSWKPPVDVPTVAADLAARRRPTLPPLGAPHGSPHAAHHGVPPGAPRRTPSPPVPALGASAVAPARRTSSAMPAVGTGAPKLPLPSQAPGPKPVDLFAPVAPARAEDPSSLVQTPVPHANGTNGIGAGHGAVESVSGRGAIQSSSDVLRLLNIPGAAGAAGQSASAPAAPAPRLMTGSEVVGWTAPSGQASRTKNARFIFALLGIIAVVCVVVTLSVKKSKPPVPVAAPKATVTDPLAAVVEKAAEKPPEPPAPEPPAPAAPPPAPVGRGKSSRGSRGQARGATATGPTQPPPAGTTATPGAPSATPTPEGGAAGRFRDGGRNLNLSAPVANRPPPSQSEIARVISNNRNGIKTCYQRALLRDSSLTHGKVTVKLSIGISGRVKHVGVDGPTQFRSVEPCMRDVVQRWVFPQASEEYGTEFVYVFQGNE